MGGRKYDEYLELLKWIVKDVSSEISRRICKYNGAKNLNFYFLQTVTPQQVNRQVWAQRPRLREFESSDI